MTKTECIHDWTHSEGRTSSGWLCRKCGDYDGPPKRRVKLVAPSSIKQGDKICPLYSRNINDKNWRPYTVVDVQQGWGAIIIYAVAERMKEGVQPVRLARYKHELVGVLV